jgi:hypothetical protein
MFGKESVKLKFVEHHQRPSCFCQWAAMEMASTVEMQTADAADENSKLIGFAENERRRK